MPVGSVASSDIGGAVVATGTYRRISAFVGIWLQMRGTGFIHESERNRTPMGHAHRDHIRGLSVPAIREMYRQAVGRLLDEVAETEEFFGRVSSQSISPKPIPSPATAPATKTKSSGRKRRVTSTRTSGRRFSWSGTPSRSSLIPARYGKGESRLEIVEDLLDSAEELVHVDNVLMDREFDSQHVQR